MTTFTSVSRFRSTFVLVFVSLFLLSARHARADLFSGYLTGPEFALPASATLFDVGADGRVVALAGTTVYRETAPGTRAFTLLGTLPPGDIPSFGAAFIRVSPNGAQIAVGNDGGAMFDDFQIGVFTLPGLTGAWLNADHFDAAWIDNQFLAVTAGQFGSPSVVTKLDTASPTPANPFNVTVIANISGASGGIAFDASGNLYTANGFHEGTGLSQTGEVHAFKKADWTAAVTLGTPIDFETHGIPIIDLLSGSPLAFDLAGDLVVGGGNSFGTPPDGNYFAVVNATAVATALGGGGFISTTDPTKVHRFDPDFTALSFYAVGANTTRNEIYAINGSSLVFTLTSNPNAVPAAPRTVLAAFVALLLVAGARRLRARA
jgi:hypothetical protein